MVRFTPISLADQALFLQYLGDYPFNTYEYSFPTLYLWRDYCNVEYGLVKDALVIKKNEVHKGSYFMQPIGYEEASLQDIIRELMEIKKGDPEFIHLFRDIEGPFLSKLIEIYGDQVIYSEDSRNFDYIYKTQRLINLRGKKLRKRKNQYRQFSKKYNYSVVDIHNKRVIKDCLALARFWCERHQFEHEEIIFELAGIADVLTNLDYLRVIGMAVYVDGIIVGFTLGEKVNSKMAIIHIEKGHPRYKGIYAFMNKTFAEIYLKDTILINRQEDLGLANLRKAKKAYEPYKLEKKYMVNLR